MAIELVTKKARLEMRGQMNIIERTALYYRLERIGAELPEEPRIIFEDVEWSNRQWDAVNQLKALVLHLQKNVNTLKKIKTPPPSPLYNYISIKEEVSSPPESEAKIE